MKTQVCDPKSLSVRELDRFKTFDACYVDTVTGMYLDKVGCLPPPFVTNDTR